MAGGLAALLDDVALIARTASASVDDVAAAAAKTSAKAAGVVVDDTAVTPQYVRGVTPARELPIIWRIAKGSLVNKLCIILPIALLLNAVAPWALTPILMLGGAFLCFEGAEKVWEMVTGKQHSSEEEAGAKDENTLVRGAITTDLILSAEIMVISLNEVADQTIWMEAAVLVAVGIFITAVVYGAVALLVKLDDVGLFYQRKDSGTARAFGAGLVKAMPVVLNAISFIGMLAMLWVGGHIVIGGLDSLKLWHAPHDVIHHLAHSVEHLGGAVAWTTETVGSLIFGLILGFIVVAFIAPFHKKKH
ncbi:hypothetical protein FRC0493_00932 [Corynebacterium diphtheriae]|uniref:DUF808 domain-containing protein n=1 Tax=Corynebacterium diphtheriae TaxID=1717 RepID=UPI0002602044|nr:DUF808 domain-containing protein [Corynebacterium diphtheriae]EIK56420.1 hypothetical protein W5M_04326 [Corynebacterium diphtheriae bv. intermedius str. NCTC 5011]OWM38217.1 ABC transporter [Corynebacterium diphtheriae bv. intermedius]CAB0641954.1 hypothetical protein CIPA99_00861 [Corynebacterium diphtheriae]CAB0643930.1 hypothetical protein CIP107566_00955 [Corynebacterium diphtheriae]CAB0898239.1 hypothetical protein FRC0426_00797 [Corynebacterium diphtheriae]